MIYDSLLSILCADTWHWDSREECQITFHANGTGKVIYHGYVCRDEANETQLVCRAELNVWIAAEFDWKQGGNQTPKTSDTTRDSFDKPDTLGHADIEMTLTKRRIPRLRGADMERYIINEALLTDDAFLPRTYHISLEKGVFLAPFDAMQASGFLYTPRFAYRLSFDKSPYPPRQEWRKPAGAPDAFRFWEWKQFCSGQIGSF